MSRRKQNKKLKYEPISIPNDITPTDISNKSYIENKETVLTGIKSGNIKSDSFKESYNKLSDDLKDAGEWKRIYRCPCCNEEVTFYEVLCSNCLLSGKGMHQYVGKNIKIKSWISEFVLIMATIIVFTSLSMSIYYARKNTQLKQIIKILQENKGEK